ncbi:MAG: YbhB/YbcL family Raf kinase inhibitor-like protein [Candidatus Omnitrophica bacterium]|nr:YbhB/YbcL family Raf kinase inhibitor-like protein [Candidatus Omnitrophota bacterium]
MGYLKTCKAVIAGIVLVFASFGTAFSLELRSPAFEEGGKIPDKHTCVGENVSPQLFWDDVPEGTKSFVVLMDDPDAPMGNWVHWVVFDIPGSAKGIVENVLPEAALPDGAKQGMNSFRWPGYGGPCPPPGSRHRYVFTLFALDSLLDGVPALASRSTVIRAMQGHILGTAELTGTYGRE